MDYNDSCAPTIDDVVYEEEVMVESLPSNEETYISNEVEISDQNDHIVITDASVDAEDSIKQPTITSEDDDSDSSSTDDTSSNSDSSNQNEQRHNEEIIEEFVETIDNDPTCQADVSFRHDIIGKNTLDLVGSNTNSREKNSNEIVDIKSDSNKLGQGIITTATIPSSTEKATTMVKSSFALEKTNDVDIVQAKINQNRVVLVKLVQNPTAISTTTTSLASTQTTQSEKVSENLTAAKSSEEGTAPTVSGMVSSTIERTVNLLNNNKIVIKSVKSTKGTVPNLESMGQLATNFPENIDVKPSKNEDIVTERKQPQQELHSSSLTATCELEKSDISKTDAENVKTEKELNDRTITNKATNTKVTPKIKREFEQLQKTVNESKVLLEFVIDRKAHGRRAKKSTRRPHSIIDLDETESLASKSSSFRGLSRSRSTSRNESPIMGYRSASKESDRSAASAGSRNKRSLHTSFPTNQKTFIQNLNKQQDSGDESEGSVRDDESMEQFDAILDRIDEKNSVRERLNVEPKVIKKIKNNFSRKN